ncbi:unnamed protein product [Prunus armeniaca]
MDKGNEHTWNSLSVGRELLFRAPPPQRARARQSKICLWACPGLWPPSTAWSCLCVLEPKAGPSPLLPGQTSSAGDAQDGKLCMAIALICGMILWLPKNDPRYLRWPNGPSKAHLSCAMLQLLLLI